MKDHNNEWLKVSTDIAIMWWVLEKCDGKHKMVDFPTYVYNIDSSKRFITSFDRLYENKEMLDYRSKVINYLICSL